MPPVLVFARLTVQESSRRRLLLALVILTLLVVGFSAWGFQKITTVTRSDGTLLPHDQVSLITSQLLIVITFMYSGVLALSAAVVAGPLVSAEVESGLLLSMLARPVRRSEVVIGKWLGLAVLVFIYAAGSAALELTAVNWATGYEPPHPIELVLYVAAEGLALLSLGLVLSTRLSGITGGVIALVAWLLAWIRDRGRRGRYRDGSAELRPAERGHDQPPAPAHRRAMARRGLRDGTGCDPDGPSCCRDSRTRQPVQRRRSAAHGLSRVGGGVVRADADPERLELPNARDLAPIRGTGPVLGWRRRLATQCARRRPSACPA